MLGTNDCKSIYHANENVIGKGIESLIGKIKRIQPRAEILLLSPIHLGEAVWKENYDPEFDKNSVAVSRKLKEVYQKIAEKDGLSFLAASDYATYSDADMEHMNQQNHKQLAEAVYEKLMQM